MTAREKYEERMRLVNMLKASPLFTGNDIESSLHMLTLDIEARLIEEGENE